MKSISSRHLMCLCLLLISLAVEFMLSNGYRIFFDSERYTYQQVNLSSAPNAYAQGIVFSREHNSITLSGLDLPVASTSLTFTAQDYAHVIEGSLYVTNNASSKALVHIGDFSFSPKSHPQIYAKLLPRDSTYSLVIKLEPKTLYAPVVLEKLELNTVAPWSFSFVRALLLFAFMLLVYLLGFTKVRHCMWQVDRRSYTVANRTMLAVVLAGFSFFAFELSAWQATDGGFKYVAKGFAPYTNEARSVLVNMPSTEDELERSDIFVQMLHAFMRGQLHLALTADPRLRDLNNVYDPSELRASGIPFYWDHVYYDGKYYSYFGLGPVATIYAPIYMLTGKVPSSTLANYIAGIYALLALYALSNALMCRMYHECNALVFCATKLAMYMGSMVLYMLSHWTFYVIPYMTSLAGLCAGLCCALQLMDFKSQSSSRNCLYMVGLALATVYVVTSRPPMVLLLLVFCLVLAGGCLYENRHELKRLVLPAISLLLPLIGGAISVMAYNYARFGSVLEFGNLMQLTIFDPHAQYYNWHIHYWAQLLFQYYFASLEYTANFPFISFGSTANTALGGGFPILSSGGVMAFSLFWALGLIGFLLKADLPCRPILRWAIVGYFLTSLLFTLINGLLASAGNRYIAESMSVVVWLCLVLVPMLRVNGDEVIHKATLWLIVVLDLQTIAAVFMVSIASGDSLLESINPKLFLDLKEILSPFSFTTVRGL